ncbi:hypothetical protein SAMN04487920_13216 [Bacillus mycoides]|nr:hypothetical protein SAMN04487920_13216 [Bacillus mycoides]
MEQAIVTLVKK